MSRRLRDDDDVVKGVSNIIVLGSRLGGAAVRMTPCQSRVWVPRPSVFPKFI